MFRGRGLAELDIVGCQVVLGDVFDNHPKGPWGAVAEIDVKITAIGFGGMIKQAVEIGNARSGLKISGEEQGIAVIAAFEINHTITAGGFGVEDESIVADIALKPVIAAATRKDVVGEGFMGDGASIKCVMAVAAIKRDIIPFAGRRIISGFAMDVFADNDVVAIAAIDGVAALVADQVVIVFITDDQVALIAAIDIFDADEMIACAARSGFKVDHRLRTIFTIGRIIAPTGDIADGVRPFAADENACLFLRKAEPYAA